MLLSYRKLLILCIGIIWGTKMLAYVPGIPINQDVFRSSIYYFEDTDNKYKFEDISAPEFQDQFTKNTNRTLSFGFTKANYWLSVTIENFSSQDKSYYIKIDNPRIREIEFFEVEDQYLLKHVETGNTVDFHSRLANHVDFIFPVVVSAQSSKTLYFRINNHGEYLRIPMLLFVAKSFESDNSIALNGFLYGVLVLLILINIFYFISHKDKVYLYFIFYIIFLFIYHMNNAGILFKYIWPQAPMLNTYSGIGILLFASSSFLFFTKYYFQVRSIRKKLNLIYRFSALVLGFIVVLVLLLNFNYISKFITLLVTILYFIFLGVLTSFEKYFKTFKAALYYRISLFVLLFGLLIMLYGNHFHFNEEFINLASLKLTLILHFLVLSFGLSERFRQLKEETDKVAEDLEILEKERMDEIINQKEMLTMQREELLSQKEELEVQKQQLLEYTEELEKLSLVAKETHNLIYIFDKEGNLEWFNKSFSSVLGFPEYDNTKKINIRNISHNKDINVYLTDCLKTKKPVIYEASGHGHSGEKFWYQTTLTPILNELGEIDKLIAIDSEITQLKAYEEKVKEQKQRVENQKKEITDSIQYAKRIQEAILPTKEAMDKYLKDSFVMFLPKDIVSGDFYWYQKIGSKHFITAVDCTGHGVPGAFMSIIGTYLLNNIVLQNKTEDPAEILKQLNRKIKISLKSDPKDALTTDGMDVAFVLYHEDTQTIEYSGAFRPLYIYSEGSLRVIQGDSLPITSDLRGTALNRFTKHTMTVKKGDMIYLFSDGIVDQFGGTRGKKFLTKRFKELLSEIHHLPMEEQKAAILNKFYEWKGGFDQVDDILVIGVRF